MRTGHRLMLGLGALNLASMALMAAVAAQDGFWGLGRRTLPAQALPVSVIARSLEAQGYGRIFALEAEHGLYVIKALDATGRRVEFRVDPVTGARLE